MLSTQKISEAVQIERSECGRVWTIILNRPHARNTVDQDTAVALWKAFVKFDEDHQVRAAVLCGTQDVFCAGADPNVIFKDKLQEPALHDHLQHGPMGPTRLSLRKPVIAAVSGYAVAGGLELACWCDMRVCDETAIFSVSCQRRSAPLVNGGTVRLPRIIGQSRALDAILTGRPIIAQEALQWGLANRVVPRGQAREVAEKLAFDIASLPQQSCMRSDRQSALEQWSLASELHALQNEYRLGRKVSEPLGTDVSKYLATGAFHKLPKARL